VQSCEDPRTISRLIVNRREKLTPDRRRILTPEIDGSGGSSR
jgi:hypothetical protein